MFTDFRLQMLLGAEEAAVTRVCGNCSHVGRLRLNARHEHIGHQRSVQILMRCGVQRTPCAEAHAPSSMGFCVDTRDSKAYVAQACVGISTSACKFRHACSQSQPSGFCHLRTMHSHSCLSAGSGACGLRSPTVFLGVCAACRNILPRPTSSIPHCSSLRNAR